MYAVTPDFQNNIFADTRSILGRVTFDISPAGIENETPTVTVSSEFALSNAADQLTNNIRQATLYLVTWELNRTILDGKFTFASATASERGEMGWVSSVICAVDANFGYYPSSTLYPSETAFPSDSSPQTATLQYATSYTSAGVTVTFDPLFGEYATNFTIKAYDASNSIIYNNTISNNALTQYALITTITNFRKIEVTVNSWSVANRRARIAEIDAGVVLVFTDDELIRFNSTEEMDIVAATLPIPEFEFTVDNSSGTFDILNPTGIYTSLQSRQRIDAEIGLDLTTRTEWVPLGTYYLSEWRSDAGSLTATFRGRSKLDLLDLTNYSESVAQVGYDLYDMAVDILTAANVSGYNIDTALQSISTNGLIAEMTCREALQMVAIAAGATIYIDRNNVLQIKTTLGTTSVQFVDFSAMLDEPQIQQFKKVEQASTTYWTNLTTSGGTQTYTDSTVANGEVIKVATNTLINTSARADAVNAFLQTRRNKRNLFTIESRGNPALELEDYIRIENRYVATQYMYITKLEFFYEGFLRCRIEGRIED